MHASDAVNWSEWNSRVLKKAKQENKPIFLTIGYFSCYWCHVLQRESFNNKEIAAVLNKKYISVVVDRELHPSLDAKMIRFAEQTIGRGGWPLNVVITPDGYPFMATIYLPSEKFQAWLTQVNELWATDPEYIRSIARDAANELNFNMAQKQSALENKQLKKIIALFRNELLEAFDEMEGGFGDSAKFPLSRILQIALKVYSHSPEQSLKENIQLTLKNMFERGMYDHLGDGFFRYTTDPGWHIPHFEKMLYDNAQLASLYFKAGKLFEDPEYIEIGKKILDFMLSKFRATNGGFYSSFSAVDGEGIEGGYYVWDKKSWQRLLTEEEQKVVSIVWGWSNPPVIDEGHLPVFAIDKDIATKQTKYSMAKVEELISSSKVKLLGDRNNRELPLDKKQLASWNALALLALVEGFEATGLKQYKAAAEKLSLFISQELIVNNKLQRSVHQGKFAGNADLEDHALVALAFNRWSSKFPSKRLKQQSEQLMDYAWAHFFSEKGWKMSDDLLIPYGSSDSMLADGPLPSASGILINLGLGSSSKALNDKAKTALQYGHNILLNQPFWYASHVSLLMGLVEQ